MMRTYTRKKQEHHLIKDIDQLCRLCLEKTEEKVPIFSEGQHNIAVQALRIMICVGIEVQDMKCLPNSICLKCHEELENYYKFRKKCEASYQRIKSHIIAVREREAATKEERDGEVTLKEEACELTVPVLKLVEEEADKYEADKGEKEEQTEEIQVIEQSSEEGTDLQTFLKSILTELSILVNRDDRIVLNDQGVGNFEIETGDDDVIAFELVEEDDEEESNTAVSIPEEVISVVNNVEIENTVEDMELLVVDSTKSQIKSKGKKRGPWCAICGKAFGSTSAVRRHARVHSGVRPFACDRCPRTFTQKAVLDRHAHVHQANRPFPCATCDKSFTQRAALAAHARRHAPGAAQLRLHTCPHCDKVFLYPSGLTRHMFVHSGRAYSCTTCGRRFNDRSSLIRHLKNKQACGNYTES